MDIFQLIGDFLHLVAMLMLVLKILANRSVFGKLHLTQASRTERKRFTSQSFLPVTSICFWDGSRSISSS
jgi:hypothetical protein